MKLIIEGPPVTKKNSPRILRTRHGGRFVAPSARYEAWEKWALLQLGGQMVRARAPTIETPVNLRALIYRKRNAGDLDNYLAAICDALQKARVVRNDKLIAGHDGSRLLVHRERPRVEIELTPLEAP